MLQYKDLREFLEYLESTGELVRIHQSISPHLEMTEISDRTLKKKGPALLFENPKGFTTPVLTNLFGTEKRIALALGAEDASKLRDIGELLAYLKEPEPPKGLKDAWDKLPVLKQVLKMSPKKIKKRLLKKLLSKKKT